ncbi:MAG: 3-deoxy-manno-octulosonate cytidylyltransferase [Campylobacteraceae bacterium]
MIIIPARLASSRFPNKILVDVLGLPMAIRTAKVAQNVDDVVIATDSNEVIEIAKKHKIKAVLTSLNHQSGTDRINEAAKKLNLKDEDIIINVQADEPFIEEDIIIKLKNQVERLTKTESFVMVSCYKKVSSEEAQDPNLVKVVIDENSNALYFSRSPIPFDRDKVGVSYFGHLGLYGFSVKSLNEFCNLKNAPLEHIEKLEQLRALSFGKKISMIEVTSRSFGIDTKEDLARAIKLFG